MHLTHWCIFLAISSEVKTLSRKISSAILVIIKTALTYFVISLVIYNMNIFLWLAGLNWTSFLTE